jgi:hypothetical protein
MSAKVATKNGNGHGPIPEAPPVVLYKTQRASMMLKLEGVTELICHNWDKQAIQAMLDKQMGKAVKKKAPKDPEREYESAHYRMQDGTVGFPVTGFKAAIVDGARALENMTMTSLKQCLFVRHDGYEEYRNVPLVRIIGEPYMRMDMVRVGMGTADIRFRPGFREWQCTLTVDFNPGMISPEMLLNLVNTAGDCGVGEWRPTAPKSKNGWAGRFKVVDARSL